MKKLLKACLCLLMIVCMVGCSHNSTSKQESVVKDFFDAFQTGDMKKVNSLCAKDSSSLGDFQDIIDEMEDFGDVNIYGETFVKEAKNFAKEVYQTMFVSYEIVDTKQNENQCVVTANVTLKDYNQIDFDSEELQDLQIKYQTNNLEKLQDIYLKQGEDAMMKQIFDDLSQSMFDIMKKQLKSAEEKKEKIEFVLIEDTNQWLISEINEFEVD